MVQAPASEHRHLTFVLGVPRQFEDIQLSGGADPDDRELEAVALLQHIVRCIEDATVELEEPLCVTGQHGNVVDATQEHHREYRAILEAASPSAQRPRP